MTREQSVSFVQNGLTGTHRSAQVGDATADGRQSGQFIRRSIHMIIELGKVTEETQNQVVVPHGIDFADFRVIS